VWTQLGRLQVAQQGQNTEQSDPPPQTTQPVTLLVTEKDIKLSVGPLAQDPIIITRNEKGQIQVETLLAKLKEAKNQQPDQAAITISAEDSVRYEDLVRLIDTVVADGTNPLFPSVSVSPASTGG
jgi:biopolymer transport protein ExbD